MMSLSERLDRLTQDPSILRGVGRGIEKEGLRVGLDDAVLSARPHPAALGSALTHARITTDYSEALLELITGVHHDPRALTAELADIHAFVLRHMPDELIWNQSMPPRLPAAADIPVGWYGTSNSGRLKHVYRLGLAERYGKPMQCIAGIHYNLSLPDAIWGMLGTRGHSVQEQRSVGYLALIRNFMRHAWLLMYLFGGSPAVSRSFLQDAPHALETLDNDTLFLPYATSLRMSDIGYQNKAQSELQMCYNDLDTFLARIYTAVTTPWPDYEAIGTHRDGEWVQLNTNVLQIENEYYSSIRPKRGTSRGERPATALAQRGVEYVEVRCLDIDPFSPVGIHDDTCRFLDAFLLFCAVEDSPHFPDGGFCRESQDNFNTVVKRGRQPGLTLNRDERPVALDAWATEILQRMQPYAAVLDASEGGEANRAALRALEPRVHDVGLTPSARVLDALRNQGVSLQDYTLHQSRAHRDTLLARPLGDALARFRQEAEESVREQQALEASDTESFDAYVARFHAALSHSDAHSHNPA